LTLTQAVDTIERWDTKGDDAPPMFMLLSYPNVHTPVSAPDDAFTTDINGISNKIRRWGAGQSTHEDAAMRHPKAYRVDREGWMHWDGSWDSGAFELGLEERIPGYWTLITILDR
jgi:hypothetical protein